MFHVYVLFFRYDQSKGDAGSQPLAQGMTKPNYFASKSKWQNYNQKGRPHNTAGQRNSQRLFCALRGLPVGDHQNVIPRQEKSTKIIKALALHKINQFNVSRIENGEKMTGEKYNKQVAQDTNAQKHVCCKAAHITVSSCLPCTCEVAENRLQAFGHSQKDGEDNEHQVTDYEICRKTDLPVPVPYNGKIIDKGYNSNRKLHNE